MLKQLPVAVRPPSWTSRRRLLEERIISDLQRTSDPRQLKQLHAQIIRAHLHHDPFVVPRLVSALASARLIHHARAAFDHVPDPNVFLWNTLIRSYAYHGYFVDALSSFSLMQHAGVAADNFTFPFILKACSSVCAVETGRMIHTHVVKSGLLLADVFIPNALIDMYNKCGCLREAHQLFDETPERDVVTWNVMLAGYAKTNDMGPARRLFDAMCERDIVSWNTMIDGYVRCGDMESAYKLFSKMPERNVVSWSTMLSGYCKAGDLDMARLLFDKMPRRTLVPWTIMIAGYAQKGDVAAASLLYEDMEMARLEPDEVAATTILSACAQSGLHTLGKRLHSYINRSRLRFDTRVCNALLDMYAKCGDLTEARRLFRSMPRRDVVSWNCMLQGLAIHGHGDRALDLFVRMQTQGVAPDAITFLAVLSACTHIGLVDDAYRYFSCMKEDFGIVPQIEHYGCMVDLLGRAGRVHEAFELIKSMPMEPNAIVWCTLLAACRTHNSVEVAEKVVDQLMALEPTNAGNYALLSNIYAATGHWDDVAKVRVKMKGTGVQKEAGASSIEVDEKVHEFTVGDMSHPESVSIFGMLERLGSHLKHVGYVPKVRAVQDGLLH
ncbi:pentatricopeptide repeat-containing protein At3g29230 [Nymphaea colorata]|nr:pentatricopeptide repeat-containing protein At3g29230 [Nymphaea colorata]